MNNNNFNNNNFNNLLMNTTTPTNQIMSMNTFNNNNTNFTNNNNNTGIYHLENTTSKLTNPLLSLNQNNNNILLAPNSSSSSFNLLNNNSYYQQQQQLSSIYSYNNNELSILNNNNTTAFQSFNNNNNKPIMMNNFTISNITDNNNTISSNNNNNCNSQPSSQSTSPLTITDNNNKNNRVKVIVRVRPQITEDLNNYSDNFISCIKIDNLQNKIILQREAYDDREFQFDKVLSPEITQNEMYKEVGEPLVNDVLKGYNGTILAYGQTGTGKTYTIFGNLNKNIEINNNSGVISRCIQQIFKHINLNENEIEFRVIFSFIEIYKENINDLLDCNKINLNIRNDPKMGGVYVENVTQIQVNNAIEILNFIKEGIKNRQEGPTDMNKTSSRSHVILTITVEQRPYLDNTTVNTNNNKSSVKRGVLTIVDLAGSERVSKSGSEGIRLEEAKKINKSLSALGNCVAALTDENITYVPFRDSKLTRLLTDSLGGNAKTCLVANIGPSLWNFDETYSTLGFATRAMHVKNHAIINEVVDFKTLSGNLQRKLSLMENEKVKLMERNVDLEKEIEMLRNELERMNSNLNNHHLDNNNIHWEERERALIDKFSNIIRHLQMEIAKQNIMKSKFMNESEDALDRMIDGFLLIPYIKQKIIYKLNYLQSQQQQYNSSDSSSRSSSSLSNGNNNGAIHTINNNIGINNNLFNHNTLMNSSSNNANSRDLLYFEEEEN